MQKTPKPPAAADARSYLSEVRTLLADQGGLGLAGLDFVKKPPAPAATAGPAPSADAGRPSEAAAAAPSAPMAGAAAPARPSLEQVAAELGPCTRCALSQTRTSIVFGTGAADAKLMFIGEGPGRDEDLEGLPFVGEAGRLLDRMLAAMGLPRESVYIANVIKCRPPKNRYPEAGEISRCLPFVRQQIEAVRPEVVVALGRCALQSLQGNKDSISRIRGTWQQLPVSWGHVAMMPTFHPAYLLRNPADKGLVWQDLQAVMAKLGLPLPARR